MTPADIIASSSAMAAAASSSSEQPDAPLQDDGVDDGKPPPQNDGKDCVRLRPDDKGERLAKMSSHLVGQAISPFLREHIPAAYASTSPTTAMTTATTSAAQEPHVGLENHAHAHTHTHTKNPNSRYCYRHRPDSKYRRAADERKMAMIKSELSKLPSVDQQAITTVWSLFSAAPSKHRELMLHGVVTQSCFSQLSTMATLVSEQLKIDYLAALPRELAIMILSYLDTVSLCKAAQVSRRWRQLSDDDAVWKHMCQQHIDRKCTKCGWGLPLLERRRLRGFIRHEQLALVRKHADPPVNLDTMTPPRIPEPNTPKHDLDGPEQPSKRLCVERVSADYNRAAIQLDRRSRPWKDVYRDRWLVGSNWKKGRCAVKVFRGHADGVTCLQLDEEHNILVTGSYDSTIKVWDIETGRELRTLRGHTSGVRALCLDKSKLFSAALDGSIRIWKWKTGEEMSSFAHTSGAITVNFQGHTMVSGYIDGLIRIWNFTNNQTYCVRAHTDWVNQLRIDSASRTVLSASDDCTVKMWDLDTRECIKTFGGHVGHVQQVLALPPDFQPDDDEEPHPNASPPGSPSSSSDSSPSSAPSTPKMDVADVADAGGVGGVGSIGVAEVMTDARCLYGDAFTSDPSRPLPVRYILTGSLDSTVRLWDTATTRCLKTWFGHLEGIWGLEGDNLRVVTCSQDSMLKVWEPGSGKCVRTFTGHTGPVACVGLSDTLMASGGEDGTVRLYSFQANAARATGSTPC